MEVRNYVEYECETPVAKWFVRRFAYLDTDDCFAESMCPEAHTTDVWIAPDADFCVMFCWVFNWNVPQFEQHMMTVLAHAGDGYADKCRTLSFFNE